MGAQEDLEKIALQGRELRLPRFDAQVAWELGSRIRALAAGRGLALVVDVRRFGQPLFYSVLEGATSNNADWIRRKSNTVAKFLRSSYATGITLKMKDATLAGRYGLAVADYAPDGGSFPLAVESAGVVGSATVSGLTQREDHNLVVEGLCALLGRDYAALRLEPESE